MSTKRIPQLSVIVPSFGCAGTIAELISRLLALENYVDGLEVIVVDDESKDGSWQIVGELSESHGNLTGIRLPRNRGQHYAVAVGIGRSSGEFVATIDCDLEFEPEQIVQMLAKLGDTADCVIASATELRDRHLLRRLLRNLYHRVMTSISRNETLSSKSLAYNFIAAKGEAIRSTFRGLPLSDPVSTKLLASDMQITTHLVTRANRQHGTSSYRLSENLQIVSKSILSSGRGGEIFAIRLSIALAVGTFLTGACWLILGLIKVKSIFRDITLLMTLSTLALTTMGATLVLATHLMTSFLTEIRSLQLAESERDSSSENAR